MNAICFKKSQQDWNYSEASRNGNKIEKKLKENWGRNQIMVGIGDSNAYLLSWFNSVPRVLRCDAKKSSYLVRGQPERLADSRASGRGSSPTRFR